jgi:hypothetical protein
MGQAEPLRVFGVFLDDLSLKNELFEMTGEKVTGTLTSQQKMIAAYSQILKDTTVQQGDFVKYQETLGNQLKIVDKEFQNLTRDIGMILIPVIAEAMPLIRQMASEIGEKLKAAVESIDWAATIKAIVDFIAFLVVNAETIAKVVAAIFILNTAFKLMAVASGIVTLALSIQTWWTAKVATGTTILTIATHLLTQAMKLIPFVAVVGGLFLLVDYFNKSEEAIRKTVPRLGEFETKALAAADTYTRFAPIINAFRLLATEILNATGVLDKFNAARSGQRVTTSSSYDEFEARRARAMSDASRAAAALRNQPKITMPDFSSLLGSLGNVAAMPALDTSALDQQQAALSQALTTANDEQSEALRNELAILDKRKSAYESFTDAVKSLFGQIKDSILSSFNLPTLGNSVNSITRNISKLLERTKGFARSISQLSGLGLNSALLQQVIQAGPMAGSQLAAALVSGGGSFISQINRAYGEFGDLAGGIAGTGTTAAFGSQQTINNYSIEVTGGLATGSDVGRAVVNAIRDFERQSGAAWRS